MLPEPFVPVNPAPQDVVCSRLESLQQRHREASTLFVYDIHSSCLDRRHNPRNATQDTPATLEQSFRVKFMFRRKGEMHTCAGVCDDERTQLLKRVEPRAATVKKLLKKW